MRARSLSATVQVLAPAPPFLYSAYGVPIACDFALPELSSKFSPVAALGQDGAPVLAVRREAAVEPGSFPSSERDLWVDRQDGRLAWAGVGAFFLSAGQEVRVAPERGAAWSAVRGALLGPVLAMALFQRGFLVLHASAVAFAVALPHAESMLGAIAFLGESGEGKSTMAAAMHARGCPVVADDIIAVPPRSSSRASSFAGPVVFPGPQRLGLWRQSLEAVWPQERRRREHLSPSGSREHKVAYELPVGRPLHALPLRALYLLGAADSPRIEGMEPAQRVVALARHCHRAGAMPGPEQADVFAACGALASDVPVRCLLRPRDLSRLPEVACLVEQDAGGEYGDR